MGISGFGMRCSKFDFSDYYEFGKGYLEEIGAVVVRSLLIPQGFCFVALLFIIDWMLLSMHSCIQETPISRPETLVLCYILAFFFSMGSARAGDLPQDVCSQIRFHIRLDMCLTIICGKADVRTALSDIRRVYQSDLQRRPACPTLPSGWSRQI